MCATSRIHHTTHYPHPTQSFPELQQSDLVDFESLLVTASCRDGSVVAWGLERPCHALSVAWFVCDVYLRLDVVPPARSSACRLVSWVRPFFYTTPKRCTTMFVKPTYISVRTSWSSRQSELRKTRFSYTVNRRVRR